MDEALRAGRVPLPTAWERAIRLFAASDAMFRAAMLLTDLAAAAIDEAIAGLRTAVRTFGARRWWQRVRR